MRKLTSLLLIMLLLFSHIGCCADNNWYDSYSCHSGYSSDDGYWEYALNDATGMPIYKIDSAQALADFKETMKPYFSFNAKVYASPVTYTPTFNEVTADCDDTFFANNALLVVYVVAGSGSFRYRVSSVEISGESLTVTIEQYNDDGASTCDMSGWLAVIKVPKEKLDGITNYCTQLNP